MPESAPLAIDDLAHAYAGQPVLAGLSLTLAPGELLAVLGPSGCGKTTLLRAVAGLVEPQRGRIAIGGTVVADGSRTLVPVEQRRVGLVFQDYALFGHLSVRANVAFGLPRHEHHLVDGLLELVGLAGYGERRPTELSGGQQQRVAVARALAPRPQLMLLDEPFANLDPRLRDDLGLHVRALLRQRGTAGLLVTHDRHDALGLADRAVLLLPDAAGARVGQLGTPAELYRSPASAAVARLTGPVWEIPAEAHGEHATSALGTVPLRTTRHGRISVLARPEDLTVSDDPAGTATVTGVRFLGPAWRVRVAVGELAGDAEMPGERTPPPVGGRVRLTATTPLWAVAAG
jgi:iron(III) transport system ATP-binding protein